MATHTVKYLIIGNSAGGIGGAEAIREVDRQGALAIVSDEPYPAYSRPLISNYLAEEYPLEKMLFRPPDFYETNNIRTFLVRKVQRLDINNHIIELKSDEKIAWDKLLLATGGSPVFPRIKGMGTRGVFTFTTLNDAKAIDHFLHRSGSSRAVVIGGGLIGISVTEALVKRGIEVTIVEMKDSVLSTILDKEASSREEEAITGAGIRVVTGHTVSQIISGQGILNSVMLDDGIIIPCHLVIVAIGVRPRLEIVSGTGIKVGRGILVDDHMSTSIPDIYACGDAAEAHDFVYNEPRLSPIWPNAYIGGRTAGFNMAGVSTRYPGGTAMNSLKYFGLDIVSAGLVDPPDDSYEIFSNTGDKTYHKVIAKDGLVVGMVFVGNIEKSGIIFNFIREKVNVDAFKEVLTDDDFGFASLPEEMWRPHLEIPSSALVSPAINLEQTEEIVLAE